jgi:hypothetical protein
MIQIVKNLLRNKTPNLHKFLFKIYHFNKYTMRLVAKSDKLTAYFYSARKTYISQKNIYDDRNYSQLHQQYKTFNITAGPFAGMSYEIESLSWFDSYESLVQKKYGIYEQEVLSYISGNTWSTLIDIGAGTGYYSLGMLRLRCCEKAILFESNEDYFPIIRRNASANSIDESRFQINGTADAAIIISKLNEQNIIENSSTLIICDIEGFENKFFEHDFIKDLAARNVTICIEVHKAQFFKYGITDNFLTNLKIYFNVLVLPTMQRNLTDCLMEVPSVTDRWLLASENRSEGCQILARPKSFP